MGTILEVMRRNIATSKMLLSEAVGRIEQARTCTCGDALRYAIITPMERIPAQIKMDLEPIIGRYITD